MSYSPAVGQNGNEMSNQADEDYTGKTINELDTKFYACEQEDIEQLLADYLRTKSL
jgi:hypothetical protein